MHGKHASTGVSPWLLLARNCANCTHQSKIDGPLGVGGVVVGPSGRATVQCVADVAPVGTEPALVAGSVSEGVRGGGGPSPGERRHVPSVEPVGGTSSGMVVGRGQRSRRHVVGNPVGRGRAQQKVVSGRTATARSGCALTQNRTGPWVYRMLTRHRAELLVQQQVAWPHAGLRRLPQQ